MSLGIASVLGLLGAFGLIPWAQPSRWLLTPWFSSAALMTVHPFTLLLARVAVDLWLPASLLMVIFWRTGLHRKRAAPQSKLRAIGLTAGWLVYVLCSAIPLMVGSGEAAAVSMFVAGIFLLPVILLCFVGVPIAAWQELVSMVDFRSPAPLKYPYALLFWAILPPLILVTPLLLAPSNPLAITAGGNDEFATLCKDTGVRFLEKPAGPVRSIAYDWNPVSLKYGPRLGLARIALGEEGKILARGGFPDRRSKEPEKIPDFEFKEVRRNMDSGQATIKPNATYYHFPNITSHQPFYGVDELSADVLAFVEVDKPGEMEKAVRDQRAVQYTMTLTDRRSGAALGIQTWVIDEVNGRACGANIGNVISQDAFIFDAIHR